MSHYPDWDVMYGPKDCSSFWDRSGDKWLKRMDELALAYNNIIYLHWVLFQCLSATYVESLSI